jgi:hypothetical protein
MFKNIVAFSVLFLVFVACSDDEKPVPQPPAVRDYATQYNDDIVKIENYLKTHSITIIDHSGFTDDQSASFTTVPNLDPNSMWGSDTATPKSGLLTKLATVGGVTHKIYYIKFRNGVGTSPTINSKITVNYKVFLFTNDNMLFEQSSDTGGTFTINQLIHGWREILPEFKMGNITGVNQYTDFGAGVMFLPSALGYYEKNNGDIPAYSPLVFTVKLYNVI